MPRTNIFGKTLVTTALLLVLLYCCFDFKKIQAALPFPHGSSVSSAPGTTRTAEPLSFRYETDVEALPNGLQQLGVLVVISAVRLPVVTVVLLLVQVKF